MQISKKIQGLMNKGSFSTLPFPPRMLFNVSVFLLFKYDVILSLICSYCAIWKETSPGYGNTSQPLCWVKYLHQTPKKYSWKFTEEKKIALSCFYILFLTRPAPRHLPFNHPPPAYNETSSNIGPAPPA
jgi:hypothetical protein